MVHSLQPGTVDEMLDCIGLVLNHLKEFNLKIKPKKMYFFQTSVVFLGHVLSKDGISPNLEKVSKVKDWPVPKSAKEVHSFLGLASYYQRFIPQFAKWASPLHELIRLVTTKKKCAGRKIHHCRKIFLLFSGHLLVRSPSKS